MARRLERTWSRLPVLLRAVVAVFVILSIGQLPPGLFLVIGLKYTPAFPWWLAATGIWLWLFWRYLDGRWWPTTTSRTRHDLFRAASLPAPVWVWALGAGSLGMISILAVALLTGFVADLPAEAYVAPMNLSAYSSLTIFAFFLNLAATAGVVEEAAFRGYMISMVEKRYGWVIAITAAAILFFLVHLIHAYATVAFIPFFAAYSLLHGVMVYLTRSVVPSVVLHALGDLSILPIQYGVVRSPFGSSVSAHVLVIACCGVGSAIALWQVARIVRTAHGEIAA